MDRMSDADEVELYDVIRKVRNDLSRAMWEGENKDLRFQIDSVEIQLEVTVSRSSQAGAKLKVVVLDADGSRASTSATRHHIKVVLNPRLVSDPDEAPWVTGPSVRGEE